ncbi:MAG: tetratricopeptide repeat protein [Akkermansiaceae bacterium]|nr:tetratricopeptide repeat protein [Akkermansiaceae bacterium]
MKSSPLRSLTCLLAGLSLLATWSHAQEEPAEDGNEALVADAGKDFFERGKNLYDQAKAEQDPAQKRRLLAQCVGIFDSYLIDFPEHENTPKAWWYLGSSFQQLGKARDAMRCYKALVQRFEEGPWVAAASYALAAEDYNKGNFADAAPRFERYGEESNREGEAARGFYYAGHCYRLSDQHAKAMEAFRKVIADPQGGEFIAMSKLGLGHCSMHLERFDEALELFLEVSAMGAPDNVRAEALLNASKAADRLDKPEQAVAHLERILEAEGMKNWWPAAHSALLNAHFEAGRYEKVIELHEASDIQLPQQQQAARLLLVGRALMHLEESEKAIKLFREIERMVAPASDLAFQASFYRLMCFYRIEGKHVPEQVDAFLELYAANRPDDTRIHTALMMKAESLYDERKVAAAAQVYNRIDESKISKANLPGLLYQRGWCLAEAGDQLGALRSLDEFIRNHSEDKRIPSALAKRAKVHERAGQLEQAVADYDRIVKLGNPVDMVKLAWLESARLRRGANQVEDMLTRYQGLLEEDFGLSPKLEAEANYWLGWGLVKTNRPKLSIEPLEKARELRGDLYGKHAGLLLALGYFAAQNIDKLAEEVHLAIEKEYVGELPDQAVQWVGMQSYNAKKFEDSATFLALIANPGEPRETPKEVWRYLGKSLLATDKPEQALPAIKNVLEIEDNPAWRADGLLDLGRAHLMLDQLEEARQAVDDALELQPQGRTRGSLRILAGDLDMKEGDPNKASAQYLIVVNFIKDKELKPLALHKLVAAQEAAGEKKEADKYREMLQTEFPDWKAP